MHYIIEYIGKCMYVCIHVFVEMGIFTIIVMHCAPIRGEKNKKKIEIHCVVLRSMSLHITYGGCYLKDTMQTFTATTNKEDKEDEE